MNKKQTTGKKYIYLHIHTQNTVQKKKYNENEMKPQITPFTCNELGFHIPFSKAMNETINFVHNFS